MAGKDVGEAQDSLNVLLKHSLSWGRDSQPRRTGLPCRMDWGLSPGMDTGGSYVFYVFGSSNLGGDHPRDIRNEPDKDGMISNFSIL
jgi:hypothetical protein